jgi:putative ABC transport system ATP-binding protein
MNERADNAASPVTTGESGEHGSPPAGREAVMELEGVTKTYRNGEVETRVLRGIDLVLYEKDFTVILGASGSGKSTLLNLIGGIDRATTGRVLFAGRDLTGATDSELTAFRRDHVGFVFQFYNLVPTLSAIENVEVATQICPDPLDPMEALRLVGLEDRAGHFPSQMSGGQQQRVSIARALAKKPGLLLCDEPTGALDKETSLRVLDLFAKLNHDLGATLLMITHAPPIAQMAHRVVRISDGVIADDRRNARCLPASELQL